MRWQIGLSLAALAITAPANMPCFADSPSAEEPRYEVYVGAGYDSPTANLSSSTVWSPFNPVNQSGFRLKFDGLAGLYGGTDASPFSGNYMLACEKDVADLMAGYQFAYGSATIKLYAGGAYGMRTGQGILALDTVYVDVMRQEKTWGGAAAFQSYWPMSDRIWASLNVTWLQPDDSTSIYSRAAYEIYRTDGGLKIYAGAESNFSLTGEPSPKDGKMFDHYEKYLQGGALLNLRYGVNDFSLSGGLSQASNETVSRPYASISYGRQF